MENGGLNDWQHVMPSTVFLALWRLWADKNHENDKGMKMTWVTALHGIVLSFALFSRSSVVKE
jgi:hypothetical protein